jgi:hypothetical protein
VFVGSIRRDATGDVQLFEEDEDDARDFPSVNSKINGFMALVRVLGSYSTRTRKY